MSYLVLRIFRRKKDTTFYRIICGIKQMLKSYNVWERKREKEKEDEKEKRKDRERK